MEDQNTNECIVINNTEDLDKCLTYLSNNTTGSLQKVLYAQLQVIKLVQNHSLLNTPIDTLFQATNEALQQAKSEQEIEETKKQLASVIQNFVFMLDARLEYAKDSHNEAKWQLIEDATARIAKTSVSIALGAVTGGASCAVFLGLKSLMPANVTATNSLMEHTDNLVNEGIISVGAGALIGAGVSIIRLGEYFKADKDKKKGLFSSISSFFKEDEKIKRDSQEFNEFLYVLFNKLAENNKLLGKDYRISGMIQTYTDNVVKYKYAEDRENENKIILDLEKKKRHAQRVPLIINVVVVILAALVFLIRGLWRVMYGIGTTVVDMVNKTDTVSEPWVTTHLLVTLGVVILVVAIGQVIVYQNKKELSSQILVHQGILSNIEKKMDKLSDELKNYSKLFNPNC